METLINLLEAVVVMFYTELITAISSIFTAIPVYFLWNWLMPTIFNLAKITFWQCWGLCLLIGLLLSNTTKINHTFKKEA